MRSSTTNSFSTDSAQFVESPTDSMIDGVASLMDANGSAFLNNSKYLDSSNVSIQQATNASVIDSVVMELDVLIKDLFILGVFHKEYADYAKRKKTYSDFRESGIVPDISINHLKKDPEHRAHFPLFKNVCATFDKLQALKNNQSNLNETEILQQLIAILKKLSLHEDHKEFLQLVENESPETKSNKQHQRLHIVSELIKYIQKSISLAEHSLLVLEQKNQSRAKKESVNTQQNSSTASIQETHKVKVSEVVNTTVQASLLQEANVKLTRTTTKNEIETAKKHINAVWQSLISKEQNPEVAINTIIKTCVSILDEFIKDKFILSIFAKDFNFVSKPTFNAYRESLFTPETFGYLMHAYPNDFLAFRQLVNLLDEITAISSNAEISRKECVRQIFARFNRCLNEGWTVDVNVRKDLSQSYYEQQKSKSTLHSVEKQFAPVEKRETATVAVITALHTYFKKLNPILEQESKTMANGLNVSLADQTPIVDESLPLKISLPTELHPRMVTQSNYSGPRLFTPPVTPEGQKRKTQNPGQINAAPVRTNSYGNDLLGLVLQLSDDTSSAISKRWTSLFRSPSNLRASPVLSQETVEIPTYKN